MQDLASVFPQFFSGVSSVPLALTSQDILNITDLPMLTAVPAELSLAVTPNWTQFPFLLLVVQYGSLLFNYFYNNFIIQCVH